jgi:hypothetical protein
VPKGSTTLKPETLLRRLASEKGVKDSIRLRAIELLMFLEGRLPLSHAINPPIEPSKTELTGLARRQDVELQNLIEAQTKAA